VDFHACEHTSAIHVVRAIGRWSLAALMVNIIIGSGIFGLPSKVASITGRQSPIAFLIAAAGIAVIAACFAEVASRFRESGGPYLYTRVAFGRFIGLQTGWLNWLSRLAAAAASANLFSVYLAEFWPRMKEPLPRVAAITFLLVVLAAINVRGVKMGTGVSNFFTVSKLTPLIVFVLGGCMYLLLRGSPVPMVPESHDVNAWLNSILLVTFAYTGFEAALIPAGEAKNPDRDAPIAILAALGICTPVYALVQFVVVRTLANPAQSDRPLVAAAHVFGGPVLATMIACGVLLFDCGLPCRGNDCQPESRTCFCRAGRLPALVRRRTPALQDSLRFHPRVCGPGLGAGNARHVQLERETYRCFPADHLRSHLRRPSNFALEKPWAGEV